MAPRAFVFNMLDYCAELEKSGFTREQAEAQARAQFKFFSNLNVEHLVTNAELEKVVNKLVTKDELEKQVQVLLKRDNDIEQSLNNKIDLLRSDLIHLDKKWETNLNKMESKIQNLGLKLTIRLGSMMVVGITLLSVINRY